MHALRFRPPGMKARFLIWLSRLSARVIVVGAYELNWDTKRPNADEYCNICNPFQYDTSSGRKEPGVPTTLVIYENEGPMIRDPERLRDVDNRMVNWFEKYLH